MRVMGSSLGHIQLGDLSVFDASRGLLGSRGVIHNDIACGVRTLGTWSACVESV